MSDISNIVNKAKTDNPNIKICISLGGGALNQEQATNWANLIVSSENRSKIVSKTVEYVINNKIDGVDVDHVLTSSAPVGHVGGVEVVCGQRAWHLNSELLQVLLVVRGVVVHLPVEGELVVPNLLGDVVVVY